METPDEMLRAEKVAERAADWLAEDLGVMWRVDGGSAMFELDADELAELAGMLTFIRGTVKVHIPAEMVVEVWEASIDA